MDVFGFAFFPFVKGALKYVEALDFKLDELFYDRAFELVRERGKERVLEAIRGTITKVVGSDQSAKNELLSYPVARILVSCINDKYLIHKYAHAEAESAREMLERPPNFLKEPDVFNHFLKELTDDFNMDAVIDSSSVIMHFTDYIRYASAFHDAKWKLINSKMNRGRVYLTVEEYYRIIQEAIRKRIESSLPLDVPAEICAALEVHLEEIRSALTARKSEFDMETFKEIMPDCFPPCMVHALSNVHTGVNIPHSMRFALTSFLLNIGMNTEKVIELFKSSPDFDEERTRYQVLHIQGATGTIYTPPSCSTMTTYGNCFSKEPLCGRISHPLGYYRKKAWIMKKGKS